MVSVRRSAGSVSAPKSTEVKKPKTARASRKAAPNSTDSLEKSNAPMGGALARSRFTAAEAGLLSGVSNRAVSAVLLGVSAFGACAGAPVAHAAEIPQTPGGAAALDSADFQAAAARLEANKDTMTPTELENARRDLWATYTRTSGTTAVRDSVEAPATRGATRMRELTETLESRMRVTARDMAHPESLRLIDGAPGYKMIDESEVRELVVDALRDVPLNELPGGSILASIARSLPGGGNLDAGNMSEREIEKALGAEAKAMFNERFGSFLRDHRVELGIAGFSAVTAARYASPEVARALDHVVPRIKVYGVENEGGNLRADASLKYRDARVLPDLDVRGIASTTLGPVSLRADLRATLSVEADEHVSGHATVGARVGNENRWADLTGTVDHTGRVTTNLELGLRQPDDNLRLTGNVYARYGEGFAVGESSGRYGAEIDLTRDVRIGNARGDFGFYASHERDFNGGHEDTRAGIMFRLRF